jgi:phospholipid/cholesterol/gamma-HCH transport system ATP-binding protein
MIEYRGIHKAFDQPVLEGIDLAVRTGERMAVVGPSGCGKSILLKTTIGLVVPDRGDVLIDGQSVFGSPNALPAVLARVGYLFQQGALFDSMTVHENVAYGLAPAAARALGAPEVTARVVRALREVNLEPRSVLNKLPPDLSGGMRKRVGLARAIVGRPEILLFDEPVSGLDPVNRAAVLRLLRTLTSRLQATMVMVTTDVAAALELCGRVALLHRGRLRFVGSPDEFARCQDPLVRAFADRRYAESAAGAVLMEGLHAPRADAGFSAGDRGRRRSFPATVDRTVAIRAKRTGAAVAGAHGGKEG